MGGNNINNKVRDSVVLGEMINVTSGALTIAVFPTITVFPTTKFADHNSLQTSCSCLVARFTVIENRKLYMKAAKRVAKFSVA